MPLLDKDTTILAAQKVMLEKFQLVALNETFKGKTCQDEWNDIYTIFTGLLALKCDDVLTTDQEQCVLAKIGGIT